MEQYQTFCIPVVERTKKLDTPTWRAGLNRRLKTTAELVIYIKDFDKCNFTCRESASHMTLMILTQLKN